jgi:SRSO17 transposase
VLGVEGDTSVWPPDLEPLRPKRKQGGGRQATRLKRDEQHQPVSVERLAASLPEDTWCEGRWREGREGMLRSRFATAPTQIEAGEQRTARAEG